MNRQSNRLLDARQLAVIESAFQQGSAEASRALARWIGKPSVIETASLEQLPLAAATDLLGASEEPICCCSTEINGRLTGEMILAFDDSSGLALTDMLLDGPEPAADQWTEMATSAALETTNILCCAYLNSLSRVFSEADGSSELLPDPPRFRRDFAGSLLQFALMGQAVVSDQVLLARTTFEIDATPVHWSLLLIPDAQSMSRLPELLAGPYR